MRLKERIRRFMQGRYGIVDQYSEFLFIVAIPMYIIGNIISIRVVSALLMGVALFLVFYVDYRIMSRNCTKRYRENEQYLMFAGIFRKRWRSFVLASRIGARIVFTNAHPVSSGFVCREEKERLRSRVRNVGQNLYVRVKRRKWYAGDDV